MKRVVGLESYLPRTWEDVNELLIEIREIQKRKESEIDPLLKERDRLKAEIEKVENELMKKEERFSREIAMREQLIEEFVLAHKKDLRNRKIELQAGTVYVRWHTSIEYPPEDVLLERIESLAVKYPQLLDAIKIKKKVVKSVLKKVAGELLEKLGIVKKKEERVFYELR